MSIKLATVRDTLPYLGDRLCTKNMRNADGRNRYINARTCRRDPARRIGDAVGHAFRRVHSRLPLDSSSSTSCDDDCSGRDSFSKHSGLNFNRLKCIGGDGSFHSRRSYAVRLNAY